MDTREFVANMVAKYVWKSARWDFNFTAGGLRYESIDGFSGCSLEDMSKLCQLLNLGWSVEIFKDHLALYISVPEELIFRGQGYE